MFAGHVGVALAAKVAERRAPLGTLIAATFGLDLLGPIFLAAIILYLRAFLARDWKGRVAFGSLVAFVALIWVSGPFSPPPPSATAVAVVAFALWVFPFWGWWVERRRGPGRVGGGLAASDT